MPGRATDLLPGDNPQAYIPGDRRRALARGEPLSGHTRGAALFVDLSGFTPLTEALAAELGGRRGAEELTGTLDRIFAALLERLHRWGGSAIYFSGDAVTAWLDGDDGTAALACATQMQDVIAREGLVRTAGGTEVRLGVKVAVAVGIVHRFVVGDPTVQRIDVLAGKLMDSLAAAEQHARPGEVVLDAGALASLGDRVLLRESRTGEHGLVGVLDRLTVQPDDPAPQPELPTLPDDVVRQWLLPPVWERMAAGRGELLAELRPAVPVFVRFGGLDFDSDPDAPGVLDEFVTAAQRGFAEQGGYVLQLTIGDKGAYLYAVFGAPIAHEDDAVRACEAALRLLDVAVGLPVTDVAVGIATGQLRSGTYGHPERRTFCCLGDAVNLAARLMARAPDGGVWIHDDVATATGEQFTWDPLDPMSVKGKTQPLRVRALTGRASQDRARPWATPQSPMVGRDEERDRLRALADRAASGTGQVVLVQAEAGTGKSRLIASLVEDLVATGVPVATGEATPLATGATYAAWRGVWADLLGLDVTTASAPEVTAAVAALEPSLAGRAPLLAPVLGLALPDSDLTASFDGALRKASLEDLLGRLLRLLARRGRVVLVIEDCHWLDPLSRDLLAVLARAVAASPVLVLLTSRPDGTACAGLPLTGLRHATDLVLTTLDPGSAASLVTSRHRGLLGTDPATELVETVVSRAEGNAFYLEQLVDYVLAHGVDQGQDPDALELPASLHSLVLSRIDAQPEGPRRAVKVASVIGRGFRSPLVANAYPDLGTEEAVHADLVTLASTRLIAVEDAAERSFAFGHAVTREVAYDSLPYGIRTVLHGRVADALEQEPDGPRRHLDLLAHHYALSEDLPKQRHYLLAAATAAKAAYANAAALGYLEQVLPIVEPDERPDVLLSLADVLEIVGDWAAAEDAVARAHEAADDLDDLTAVARTRTAQAELARKQGRYAESEAELAAAETAFRRVDDTAGLGRVLHLRGTLASQQGDPTGARAAYEASLGLRRELGDDAGVAAMLTNLALVAEDEGDLDAAEQLGLDALARRRALDDRRAISVSLTNMGMLATAREELDLARERFTEAQSLAEEVGDPWVVAVGRHNLGNVTRDLGDTASAAGHLAHALEAYADHADRWSLAHLFEDVALWLVQSGDSDGSHDRDFVRLLASAGRVRDEIGAPRFPPTEAALDQALTPVRARSPSADLRRAEQEGADQDLASTVAVARNLLAKA